MLNLARFVLVAEMTIPVSADVHALLRSYVEMSFLFVRVRALSYVDVA